MSGYYYKKHANGHVYQYCKCHGKHFCAQAEYDNMATNKDEPETTVDTYTYMMRRRKLQKKFGKFFRRDN